MGSTKALFIGSLLLTAGFIFATFYTRAPFGAFATAIVGLFTAFITKRLIQKHKRFNGNV